MILEWSDGLGIDLLKSIWMLLYAILVVSVVLLIMLENRNPIKAIGWLLVLLFLPFIGLVIYFFFGRDSRGMRLMSKRTYQRILSNATPRIPTAIPEAIAPSERYSTLSNMITQQCGAPLLSAKECQIYTEGDEMIEALLRDIASAQQHIHMQYYVIASDSTGERVVSALLAKAAQGIQVRLLYDHVGSWEANSSFFKKIARGGIEVVPFLRVVFPLLTSKVNYRNHRKVVVIDGVVGYIGGMNIADRYTLGNHLGKWRDTHMRITGSAVGALQASFVADWYAASQRILPSSVYQHSMPTGSAPMQIFQSGPTDEWRTLLQTFCRALYGAQHSVLIETPYFLPNETLMRAIIGTALSGVEVRLILPHQSDSWAVRMASDSYLTALLRAGVRIYRYQRSFIHSKLMVVDDTLAILGSANLDFRSLEHNFELTAVIYDKDLVQRLRNIAERDFNHSIPLSRRAWQKRPFHKRLAESVMRLFSPLL